MSRRASEELFRAPTTGGSFVVQIKKGWHRTMKLPTGTEYGQLLSSLRLQQPWALHRLVDPHTDETETNAFQYPSLAPPSIHDPTAHEAERLLEETRKRVYSAEEHSFHGIPLGSVLDAIETSVLSAPDRIAISDGDRTLSYRELDLRAEQLAARLLICGVVPGDIVAVVLPRSIEFVEAMLAVWKVRGAFLPLAPDSPLSWRQQAALNAGAAVCLSDETGSLPQLTHVNPYVQVTNSNESKPIAVGTPQPDDLAYVIYTSGSTGEPKLVMIDHRGVGNLVRVQKEHLTGLDRRARILQFLNPTFDGAIFEIILGLAHGGRLEIAPVATEGSIDELLFGREITHTLLPASVVRMLQPGRFPALRVLMSGGDVCLPETARRWRPFVQFVNAYGPTEITVCCTLQTSTIGDEEFDFFPIGREVAGCHIVLLNESLAPVNDGEVGEICIGGLGVGRGYFGMPEATAAAFIADPFSSVRGSRLYRSGDYGRRHDNGIIEFLGRRHSQVKIRGFRVDLLQIEAALSRLPGVCDAVVVVDNSLGEKRLLGYVIARSKSLLEAGELRAALRTQLPEYLIPTSITILQDWPLNSSGKVQRSKLPLPASTSAGGYQAPRSPDEDLLAKIAAELLGLERIGIDDDFFELGGSSLLAIQFIARIRTVFHKELPFSVLIEMRTIENIANSLADCPAARSEGPQSNFTLDRRVTPSYAQERAWLLHKLDPHSLAYNAQSVMRWKGFICIEGLEASLTDIVRRHDVLRTRFREVNGELQCELLSPWEVKLQLMNLTDMPTELLEELFGTVARKYIERPFILSEAPLARWPLIKTSEDEHVLIIHEHHTVHDGWSFNVFVDELIEGYAEWELKGLVRRPKPAIQYYDHADWQREWCATQEATEHRRFWREALAGVQPMLQLARRTTIQSRQFRGSAPRLDIDRELSQELEALGREQGSTLFITLLAAFFVLLHRYSGSEDILVASGAANRRWQSTEQLIGMFVNTVALRGQLHGDPHFSEFLAQVRETALQAYDHQELPFEMVLEEARTERIGGVGTLVQHCFSFHDAPHRLSGTPSLEIVTIEGLSNGSSKFDLNIIVIPRYSVPGHMSRVPGGALVIPAGSIPRGPYDSLDGLTLSWEFDSNLYDTTFIQGIMTAYQEVLRSIVRNRHARVSELSIVPPETRLTILEKVRNSSYPEDSTTRLHDLVQRWTSSTPNATAVATPTESLTYSSLMRCADRVAFDLSRDGIGRGDVVGVLLAQSPRSIATLLGIMKAGAAYLPLDPSHPWERINVILVESSARVLISDSEILERFEGASIDSQRSLLILNQLDEMPIEFPVPAGSPNDLAYVIYTSGSTGRPKGVPVEHRSIVARLAGVDFYREGQAYIHHSSLSFDFSVAEIFGPLSNGKTVYLPKTGWGMLELRDCIVSNDIRHLSFTTSLFHQLATELPDTFDRVDHVVVGGEVLSPETAKGLLRQGMRISNYYGPTETTVFACRYTAPNADDFDDIVPIGTALPNCHYVLVDKHLNPVPPGVTGEICIGGPGVARGYLNQPELTSQKFVSDPFSGVPGARLYRTGDLGRVRHDGELEFIGRHDSQIKIRGFLVEPSEIQAALTSLPEVAIAQVVSDLAMNGERRLVAYVQVTIGSGLTGRVIRAELRSRLPEYLVPAVVMLVNEWPLNESGKIDRARLPSPLPERDADFLPPLTEDEVCLSELIKELLGAERFGLHDDFFEWGGTSLAAMKLVARIATVLGKKISFATVFMNPTIAQLLQMPEFSGKSGDRGQEDGIFAREAM
jgi:amino acid adenylation domain-containing protein